MINASMRTPFTIIPEPRWRRLLQCLGWPPRPGRFKTPGGRPVVVPGAHRVDCVWNEATQQYVVGAVTPLTEDEVTRFCFTEMRA